MCVRERDKTGYLYYCIVYSWNIRIYKCDSVYMTKDNRIKLSINSVQTNVHVRVCVTED